MVHKDAVASGRLLGILCFAVLGVILNLGLWPFHVPVNDVAWLANRNGLKLGRASTVLSADTFQAEGRGPGSGSIEIWLQPARVWVASTFLAFSGVANSEPFRMRQSLTDLELHEGGTSKLYVDEIFRQRKPRFISVTSGVPGTAVYVDGVLAKTARFRLSAADFAGRLILGDAPEQTDSWTGTLLGAAVYARELTAAEVSKHYQTWSQQGRPEINASERCRALYLFDERAGEVVHSRVGPGVDLRIPARYMVLDQRFLEPVWEEFSLSRSYASAALKNIVGFVPVGFVFFAYLSGVRGMRRAALITVLLGTLISLSIEVLQGFLPTRDSGTTDLITNTLGTWLGVWLYLRLHRWAAATFPWLPLFPTPRR